LALLINNLSIEGRANLCYNEVSYRSKPSIERKRVFLMLEQGYGIMPNKILKDTKISSTSKLVFCLISSLSAESGKCYATNRYIGEQLGLKGRQITYCLRQLEQTYINCNMVTSEKREITLVDKVYKERKKMHTPMQKNAYPHAKNDYHNNITKYYNLKREIKYKTPKELGLPDLSVIC
jgi:hypothetical protein